MTDAISCHYILKDILAVFGTEEEPTEYIVALGYSGLGTWATRSRAF